MATRILRGDEALESFLAAAAGRQLAPASYDRLQMARAAFDQELRARARDCSLVLAVQEPAALVMLADRPWESRLLARPSAEIVELFGESQAAVELALQAALDDARKSELAFVSCRCPNRSILYARALSRVGFLPVDLAVRLEMTRAAWKPRWRPLCEVTAPAPEDGEWIATISGRAIHDARFAADPFLGAASGEALYAEWVRSGLANPRMRTLVARGPAGEASGFLQFDLPSNKAGRLSLLAVDASRRRAGVGPTLVASALEQLFELGCETVSAATQSSNYETVRLYQGLGFVIRDVFAWYHWHAQ